ncbi:MAG: hypothetical protein MJ209_06560, partial [archaeon]|nr:hypothetical protein [archaeon]
LEILQEISDKTCEKIPKDLNKKITNILLGKDKELPEKDDLFKKRTFVIKNVPITPKGTLRERMSFRKLRLNEFGEEWDNSNWKLYFEETTFITILWKEPKPGTKTEKEY